MRRIALFLIPALINLSGSLTRADLITQTKTLAVSSTGTEFFFDTFDQRLGTLNSVAFTLVESLDSGSLTVKNNAAGNARVRNPLDSFNLVDNQGGHADYIGSQLHFTTNPTTPGTSSGGFTLGAGLTQSFGLVSIDNQATMTMMGGIPIVTNLTAYKSLYQSATGSTQVSFTADHQPMATVTGGNFVLTTENIWLNNTTLQLTYDYTPTPVAVPEPGTIVLAGLICGVGGGLVSYRKMRRKNAAVPVA